APELRLRLREFPLSIMNNPEMFEDQGSVRMIRTQGVIDNRSGAKQIRFGERPFRLPLIQRRQIDEYGYTIPTIVAEPTFSNVERLPQFDLCLLVVSHL